MAFLHSFNCINDATYYTDSFSNWFLSSNCLWSNTDLAEANFLWSIGYTGQLSILCESANEYSWAAVMLVMWLEQIQKHVNRVHMVTLAMIYWMIPSIFTATFCSAPAPRIVSVPVISWSGPAAAEARWRIRLRGLKHGSGEWVGDGLALSPPAFPRFSALSGCGLPPLSDSSWLIFSPRRLILFLYPEWLVFCRGNTCITVILGSYYESFHIRPCLLVWLFGSRWPNG